MNILIIDKHPAEDGRLFRHVQYLLRKETNVFRLHINRDDEDLPSGVFSKYGEKGFRINIRKTSGKIYHLLNFYSFCLALRPQKVLGLAFDTLKIEPNDLTILHVHDPALLLIAFQIKKKYFRSSIIVYDRHEVYENGIVSFGIRFPGISRLFEILSEKYVDGIVSVSPAHNENIHRLFPEARVVTVPNYSSTTDYDQKIIDNKIQLLKSGAPINLIYVGSLSNMHDRDIDLLIKIADAVLKQYSHTVFRIGGECNNVELLKKFDGLHAAYRDRFQYLGLISREETIRLTEISHIGFFLIRPDTSYWVKCSPNKVFEYLFCGVIPVIRADIDEIDEMDNCCLTFGRTFPEDAIIHQVLQLVGDLDTMIIKIQKAIDISDKFSFDLYCDNYMGLYLKLLNKDEISLI